MIKEILYAFVYIVIVSVATYYNKYYGYITAIFIVMLYLHFFIFDYNNKCKKPKIKHNKLTQWNWMVSHPENLKMGDNVDIGAFTYIQAENGVDIGNNVQIGSHCSIYSKNTIDKTHGSIIIKDNVKIGSHTVILPKTGYSLIIEENSIIGSNSLIKDHVEPNSLYYGIPAKKQSKGDFYAKGL